MPRVQALRGNSDPYILCKRGIILFILFFLEGIEGDAEEENLSSESLPEGESFPPIFLRNPQDAYVIRNRPANLTCIAAHALKVTFKCKGLATATATPTTHDTFFVDPMTGIRKVEALLRVPRVLIDTALREGARCHCIAWSSRGQTQSASAKVNIAYFRRHFNESPYSRSVGLGSEVELRCIPPEGSPPPVLTWIKQSTPVDFKTHNNYRFSSEGSLLILSAQREDAANFSCVAENVAGRRVSETATLRIYVDGSWSSWSSWSSCSSRCGRGFLRRSRMCTEPVPSHGGAACQGIAMQKTDCSSPCPAVHGQWSLWSEWSTCGLDCRRYRRRSCDAPAPLNGGRYCYGKDLVATNCSGGMCQDIIGRHRGESSGDALEVALRQDMTLIVVLGVLVPLIILLFVLGFKKYNRNGRSGGPLYDVTFDYPLSFCSNAVKKNKKSIRAELTRSVSVGTTPAVQLCYDPSTDPASTFGDEKSEILLGTGYDEEHYSTLSNKDPVMSTATPVSEHHYDVPHIRSISPETVHLLGPPQPPPFSHGRTTPTTDSGFGLGVGDWKGESYGSSLENAFRSASHSSFSENTSDSLQRFSTGAFDLSEKLQASVASKNEFADETFSAAAWGAIGTQGGRIDIPNCSISLTIPEGSFPPDSPLQNVYITVITSSDSLLQKGQTLLSPIVSCGPGSLRLKKPAIVSFEHCGSLQHATWRLHLMGRLPEPTTAPTSGTANPWEKLITLGEERIDTPIYTQLDGSQIHLLTESLQQYCLVGESSVQKNAAVKQLRIIVAARSAPASGELVIAVHIVPDTTASVACISQQEKKRGSCLLDKPKAFLLRDCGSNLSFSLDEVNSGWKLKPGLNHQEQLFDSVWSSSKGAVTTNFIFERQEGIPQIPLSCRVILQQKASTTYRQILRVNTDFPYAPVTASPQRSLRDSTVTWVSGCLVNVTPDRVEPFRIPQRMKKDLCRCLDPPNARGNDWRMLAARLNVDRYLFYFASKSSPTEHILNLSEARHREATALTDLLNVLRGMERPDAAHSLETHSGAWI